MGVRFPRNFLNYSHKSIFLSKPNKPNMSSTNNPIPYNAEGDTENPFFSNLDNVNNIRSNLLNLICENRITSEVHHNIVFQKILNFEAANGLDNELSVWWSLLWMPSDSQARTSSL